jgi:hypothetical protein
VISLADLKAYLGGTFTTADEAILTDLEERAVALVERATGRYFGASGSHTYTLEGSGDTSVWVNDTLSAVTSVSTRDAVGEDWTALESDDYEQYGSEFLRASGLAWPDGRALVQIVATRGYATDAEPGPIRQLVLDLVNWQFRAGRKLTLEDVGSPDVAAVKGWERTIGLYRGLLCG